ncbi:Flagellar motor protein MotB [Tenacibaculum soleae]|uniref:OmpA family protein n=1 Tax=Tenacibaculum soleae TaxID=447689 RepID=UPI003AB78874
MKKITFVLLTAFTIFASNAQNEHLKRANKYFNRTFYNEAIPLYKKAIKDEISFEAIKNLADAYYYLNNMQQASANYKTLLKNYSKLLNESYYFKYATTLKATKKYNEANNILLSYYKKHDTLKLTTLKRAIKYLENVSALGNRFKIKNLNINTPQSEFGAIQKGENIIFATPKKEKNAFNKPYGWNGQSYLDLYTIPNNKIHLGDSLATSFSENINTKLHEATIVFTKDGKTAYFTRNNFIKGKRKKDSNKITHVQIYKTEFINGEWTNISPLPFNNDEYSTEHPSLSYDEKILYFASDMPNGFGSFDIYSVAINNNGTFDAPKNLGATINTSKKEQFPFASKDNKLYFSSNGHPGFGSLDVFVSTISNENFSKPDNVGFPINSGYDDFSFNINADTKEGFFASNRQEGKGNDDIYQIKEEKPLIIENCKQFISGIITDIDTNKALANTLIYISKDKNELEKVYTNVNGAFRFNVICEASYIITATKKEYQQKQKTIITTKERNKNNDASLALKSIAEIEKEKRIALELKTIKEKELKIKAKNKLELENKAKIEKIIASEKNIEKKNGKTIIKTEQINFDYNLWYLRRDTKKEIDKVIELMKKYPEMIVEIGTHSDIRGKSKYNLELSQKRATSTRMYFMEKGIEPDRIFAVGYGETKPIIKCKTEDSCTEEQHELNRRCEFVIKKIL